MAFLLSAISIQSESSLTKWIFPSLAIPEGMEPFERNAAIHKKLLGPALEPTRQVSTQAQLQTLNYAEAS